MSRMTDEELVAFGSVMYAIPTKTAWICDLRHFRDVESEAHRRAFADCERELRLVISEVARVSGAEVLRFLSVANEFGRKAKES